MAIIAQIIVLSLLIGFVAAGFIWYGGGLAQNLRAVLPRNKPAQEEPAAEAKQEAAADEAPE